MIEIQDIKTDNRDDIINLLLDERQQPFEIYFPKFTVLFSNTNEDIAEDYARLAYVGHRLSQISDNISYEVVPPYEHSSVLFEVTAKNFGSLAELLLELSYLYENDEESEVEYNYWDDVYQYIYDVENGEYTPSCPEFIEFYQEYINKNKEKN